MEGRSFDHPEVPATADLSQIVQAGPLLFLSGQIGVGPDGRVVGPSPERQIRRAFTNVRLLLEGIGGSLEHVVKITSYLTTGEHKPTLAMARREFFAPPYPASTLLIVKGLASPDYLYEVDVVAVADASLIRRM